VIGFCVGILLNVVVQPNICLLLLLLASTLLVYVSDRRRKSREASIRELEALFALRDVRSSVCRG
jgi:hypothetical protein